MDKNPDAAQVSLITPMYLCESYVEDFLDSMCAQKHQNIEIICVIDGSPDGTLDKVTRYAQKDSRIKVILIEHSGAGVARNIGMDEASGEYLMFPDADDSFKDTYVSSLLNSIEAHQADLAVSRYTLEDDYFDVHRTFGYVPSVYSDERVYSPSDIIDPLVSISNAAHNKIFRKSFVMEHGLRFMETMSLNDVFFSTTALLSAPRTVFFNESHYTYRKDFNPYSISRNRGKTHSDCIEVFNALYEWLASRGLFEKYKRYVLVRWRQVFSVYSACGYSKPFCEMIANYLAAELPWKTMSGTELYFSAGLDTSIMRLKSSLKPKNAHNNQLLSERLRSEVLNKKEIRRLLHDEYGVHIGCGDRFFLSVSYAIKRKAIDKLMRRKASKESLQNGADDGASK